MNNYHNDKFIFMYYFVGVIFMTLQSITVSQNWMISYAQVERHMPALEQSMEDCLPRLAQ